MSVRNRNIVPSVASVLALGTLSVACADTIEGFTEPYRTIDVSAGEPGVVTSVLGQPGAFVRQGDVLVTLDSDVLEATLAVAKQKARSTGVLDAANAELKLRRERATQIRTLRERGHATHGELVRAETDLEIALARVKQAEEETELYGLECQRIQAQIDRRHIRSPINGVVAEGYKEVGEAVLASDPRLLTLVQLDQLRIRFSAVPDQTARIRPGQSAEMCLAENSQPIHGTVDRIDAVMDAKSGTLDIHVVIDNTHGQLRSGMRCLLSISNTTSHLQRSPTTAHNPTRRVGLPP